MANIMLEKYLRDRLHDRRLLIMAHAVAGYPSLEDNWRMLECMRDAGVAMVELQLPFSEPIADGPVFVQANQGALQAGMRRDKYFEFMSRATAEFEFPILFMGYYNTVFCMGEQEFCRRLSASGASGYIIADLPPESAAGLDAYASAAGLAPVHIMTPTNTDRRLAQISHNAGGFIYCVARKGVTGEKTALDQDILDYIKRCRHASSLPLALGFGIKTPGDVRRLNGNVDIAIIGTACLEIWEAQGESGFRQFLQALYEETA